MLKSVNFHTKGCNIKIIIRCIFLSPHEIILDHILTIICHAVEDSRSDLCNAS